MNNGKPDRTEELCNILKQGFEMLGRKLDSLEESNKQGIEFINQELLNALKMGMKYERENAKQIISANKKKLDQLEAGLTQTINQASKKNENDGNLSLSIKELQLSVDSLKNQLNGLTDIVRHMDLSLTETQATVKVLPQVLDKPQPQVVPMMQPVPMQMPQMQAVPAPAVTPVPEAPTNVPAAESTPIVNEPILDET